MIFTEHECYIAVFFLTLAFSICIEELNYLKTH